MSEHDIDFPVSIPFGSDANWDAMTRAYRETQREYNRNFELLKEWEDQHERFGALSDAIERVKSEVIIDDPQARRGVSWLSEWAHGKRIEATDKIDGLKRKLREIDKDLRSL